MRRNINSIHTAMPFVILLYVFTVLVMFLLACVTSDLPLISIANLNAHFDNLVMPHASGLRILVIMWLVTGLIERWNQHRSRKKKAEADRAEAEAIKMILAGRRDVIIPGGGKRKKLRDHNPLMQ